MDSVLKTDGTARFGVQLLRFPPIIERYIMNKELYELVKKAIEEVGLEEFKKISWFSSNQKK